MVVGMAADAVNLTAVLRFCIVSLGRSLRRKLAGSRAALQIAAPLGVALLRVRVGEGGAWQALQPVSSSGPMAVTRSFEIPAS